MHSIYCEWIIAWVLVLHACESRCFNSRSLLIAFGFLVYCLSRPELEFWESNMSAEFGLSLATKLTVWDRTAVNSEAETLDCAEVAAEPPASKKGKSWKTKTQDSAAKGANVRFIPTVQIYQLLAMEALYKLSPHSDCDKCMCVQCAKRQEKQHGLLMLMDGQCEWKSICLMLTSIYM